MIPMSRSRRRFPRRSRPRPCACRASSWRSGADAPGPAPDHPGAGPSSAPGQRGRDRWRGADGEQMTTTEPAEPDLGRRSGASRSWRCRDRGARRGARGAANAIPVGRSRPADRRRAGGSGALGMFLVGDLARMIGGSDIASATASYKYDGLGRLRIAIDASGQVDSNRVSFRRVSFRRTVDFDR